MGFVVHSFAGDDPMALRDHVKALVGLDRGAWSPPASPEPLPAPDADKVRRALALWHEASDPRGTRVELYLRNRGLSLPSDPAGVLRYHPRCPFGPGVRTPCMIALVRAIAGDAPTGILRIALTGDGRKSTAQGDPKRTLGVVKGGAVKLAPDDRVTTALGVAEGVENALAMVLSPEFGGTPSWALLGAAGMASLPVLAGVETLWIGVDRDPAGEAAAHLTGERWALAGREVHLMTPRQAGSDLNDCTGGRA